MSAGYDPLADSARVLELAQSDPREALQVGSMLLGQLANDDHVARSMVFRALGIASRLGADMTDSLAYGEQSVFEATQVDEPPLLSKALMSLAGSTAFSGDNAEAIRILDRAVRDVDPQLLAELEFQRGTILARMGETTKALACYSSALPVFEGHGDTESMAMTLHNRATVQVSLGNLVAAESDLLRARAIDDEGGSPVRIAGEQHGLGVIAWLRGDIPLALALLEDSKRRFTELIGSASESQVSLCEVLLSAGLFREALTLATAIARDLHESGLAEDEAEARLVAAQSGLLAGRPDVALKWANRAVEMFSEQGRPTWAATARLTGIQVQFDGGVGDAGLLEEARTVAGTLEREGQISGALRARLLAGMIGTRLGLDVRVVDDLTMVADKAQGPIEAQLQSRLARVTIRLVAGDLRGADAAARAGMRLLDEYQAALGATDVRLGVERHGMDLGNLGLSLALGSRRARRAFRWMELRRGRALSLRPVTPPDDDDLADLLASLRHVTAELRTADVDVVAGLRSRQRRLQESVRSRARTTRGTGAATPRVDPATFADALDDRSLVEFASLDGMLWAVVVRNARFRLRELGPEAEVMAELESLRFAMRRLARGRGSLDAAPQVARRLDGMLFGSMRLGDGPLVIVPTPTLHATPWWAMSTCQARPVSISPSAELWYVARQATSRQEHVLVAAGPDLELSDAEVAEVGALYPGATLFRSEDSLVETVQTHLDGAGLAHIASHAYFQFENPMFSSLRLADGDLNVYDIERLSTAPSLVVLSACDSGFTETHPGEELMGLSSALLSMGTKTVIASVGIVPDSAATKDLMVALHRGLIAGLSPSHALQEAQSQVAGTPEGYIAASSFICIGAG